MQPVFSHLFSYHSALSQITIGELEIITPHETMKFGKPSPAGLSSVLRVKNDSFWMRVALFTDLGLAESYMYGDGMYMCHMSSKPCSRLLDFPYSRLQ
jgi:hypothetical protein